MDKIIDGHLMTVWAAATTLHLHPNMKSVFLSQQASWRFTHHWANRHVTYTGGKPEVLRMTKQELKSIEQQNFKELKQKVAAWEKAGIIDQIAAKIYEKLENLG